MAKFQHGSLVFNKNSEQISSSKNLVYNDAQLQFLEPINGDQNVNLPTETQSPGLAFWLINTSSEFKLNVYSSGGNTFLLSLNPKDVSVFICDGTAWKGDTEPTPGGTGGTGSLGQTGATGGTGSTGNSGNSGSIGQTGGTGTIGHTGGTGGSFIRNSVVKTSADNGFIADKETYYMIDVSSAGFTGGLPPSPTSGLRVFYLYANGDFSQHNFSVDGNGNKIEGQTGNYIINSNGVKREFVFINSTIGWRVF